MNVENYIPAICEYIYINKVTDNDYLLCNDVDKHYLHVGKDVYRILLLIDGEKDIAAIQKDYENKYNTIISSQTLYEFITQKLSPYGIIKDAKEKIQQVAKPSYLKLSFTIISEKRIKPIAHFFSFMFNPYIAWSLILLCLISTSILIVNNLDLYKTFNSQKYIALFILTITISVFFHEIGHAAAASSFGAKHRGIGGGFYFFSPVLYADVTDIWRLKKKQRIVVNVAGVYFEFIFISILIIISQFMNLEMLLMVSILVLTQTFYNLIPFIRSDGYWIVSDLLNSPNLMNESMKKVRNLFPKNKEKWNFHDYILFFYGVVTYLMIGSFLYYILIDNPNSIIYFPINVYKLFISVIKGNTTTFIQYGKLIPPLVFYIMCYNYIKTLIKRKKLVN
jgi:putative peptide zinc metalloprotease protein